MDDGTYLSGMPISQPKALLALHDELSLLSMIPGWYRPGAAPMWESPCSSFGGSIWSFQAARGALSRAGSLVDTELAERRNLILANGASKEGYPTLRTHVLAYQMILPGERARTHRHTSHAGRLILEADEGAYTVVDGARIEMRPGDVVLTPSGSWHGHGHEGLEAAYWVDFLDVPLVHLLEPMFFEPYPGGWQEPDAESSSSGLVFSWKESQARLEAATPGSSGEFNRVIKLGSPSPALPTIGLSMCQLDADSLTNRYRSTANYEFCVVKGSGRSWIAGQEFQWTRGDVLAVPCWSIQHHFATEDSVLLAITDEPLQRYCGYLRTQKGDEIPELESNAE